jgi:excisionase family DNA binding protein
MFEFTPVKSWCSLADAPDILTVEEVASYLRISRGAVYAYINRGMIPGRRFENTLGYKSKRVWIPKKALIDFIEGETTE